jgi:hypothetical protein
MVVLIPEQGVKAVTVNTDIIIADIPQETVCRVALQIFILPFFLNSLCPPNFYSPLFS